MKTHQSGSVLAISLVLLTAITLIALMGLQRSGLQTRIVANLQHKENVFSIALSEVEFTYNHVQQVDTQILSDAFESPDVPVPFDTGLSYNPLIQVDTSVEYQSNGNTMGLPNTSRLRDQTSRGRNGAGIENFKIASTAATPNGISSSQLVGITVLTPEQ
jgi:hypothetical protein